MPYYKVCPLCSAALDPGEKCDCHDKEKAVPVLQHQDGSKVESELSDPHSASNYNPNEGGFQV